MAILEIEHLTHLFGQASKGIEDICLTVGEGELVVIVGANGSGKTTFLRHLNGLLLPQKGSVRLNGACVSDDLIRARQLVGMVFQDADSQIVGETVFADVCFGPENLGLCREEIDRRAKDALGMVGLLDLSDQRPHLLSGGEKRRLAIAGVLAMEPKVIVFDEPFSNLDYPGVCQVLAQILNLRRMGRTILLSTHDLEKVIAHADRIVVLKDGRLIMQGPPQSVVQHVEAFGVRAPCAVRLGLESDSWLN
jgi:biotin transport system ATP-binding protein